jgi:hypothetical protein
VEYLEPQVEYLEPQVEYLEPQVEYLEPPVHVNPMNSLTKQVAMRKALGPKNLFFLLSLISSSKDIFCNYIPVDCFCQRQNEDLGSAESVTWISRSFAK